MKYYLLFVALIFGINSWAQEYHPLLECTDRKEASWSLIGSTTYWYNDIGDTTINNVIYRKWQFNSETESRLGVLIREDTLERKVYTYDTWNEKEDLLYDFSLYLKEEYVLPNGISYLVSDIDSIETCQGMRARWHFDGPGPGFVVVESIGSLEGLRSPYYANISDPVGSTLCIFNKCEKMFGDDCSPHPRWNNEAVYETYAICEGESIMVHDSIISTEGTYEFLVQDPEQSCPTPYFIDVELYSTFTTEVSIEFCQGSSVDFNNQTYSSAGTYYVNEVSTLGCDSIIQLEVREIELDTMQLTVESCDSYVYQGEQIFESGQYEFILPSSTACDTIVQLDLRILDSYEEFLSPQICEGDSFVIGDVAIYDDTPTVIFETNSVGCDSVIYINPMLLPVTNSQESIEICEGESISIAGQMISTSGTYVITSTGSNSCDSIHTIDLTVLPENDPLCFSSTENVLEEEVNIYFTSPYLHVDIEHGIKYVSVHNISGQLITEVYSSNQIALPSSSSGIYIVTLLTMEGDWVRKKVFVD